MNQSSINILKGLRKIYTIVFRVKPLPKPESEQDPDKASQLIYDKLMIDQPCMIARFGSTELSMLVNYLGIKDPDNSVLKYIQGKTEPWWWEKKRMFQLQNWSGFFPPTEDKITQFCELILEDMKEVDVLGSWIANESFFLKELESVANVKLVLLEPYTSLHPWSRYLQGKKVLVIHPFAKLIESQYQHRAYLFKDKNVLPDFKLETIPAVQSLGGENNGFEDWFDALNWMKDEIDKHDYDVCLIGAGAYGFSLAAHVKRSGKKAIHLGGALQLLFGIKGNRWEEPDYAVKWGLPSGTYLEMFNQYWVKPSDAFKPANANSVENACYW